MTDVFYVVVKGSLTYNYTSVFGLNDEEVAALTKRYGTKDSVVNGVSFKATPMQILNSLSLLGYRVASSCGESEIAWTLSREILSRHYLSDDHKVKASANVRPPLHELPKPVYTTPPKVHLPPQTKEDLSDRFLKGSEVLRRRPATEYVRQPVKTPVRIGTKPEELAEFLDYSGSRIVVTSLEDLAKVPEGQKVIIKSNLDSEENPMYNWESENHNKGQSYITATALTRDSQPVCVDMSCTRNPAVPSVYQTLDEMDFDRGLWSPALHGDLNRVRMLLQKGHDPNAEDKNGYTALHYAAKNGHTAICDVLLESGALANKVTKAGYSTALHRAALAGHNNVLKSLIKYGGSLIEMDADGRIPLHRAVEGKHSATVEFLIKSAPGTIHSKDKSGRTPRDCVDPNDRATMAVFENMASKTTSTPGPARVTLSPSPSRKSTTMNKTPPKQSPNTGSR